MDHNNRLGLHLFGPKAIEKKLRLENCIYSTFIINNLLFVNMGFSDKKIPSKIEYPPTVQKEFQKFNKKVLWLIIFHKNQFFYYSFRPQIFVTI